MVAEEAGLLDITLDKILASSCRLEFDAALDVDSEVSLTLELDAETKFTNALSIELF